MLRNSLERSTHPSPEQITALLQYMEDHPELARGFPKLPAAKNKIKRQWEKLAPRLNRIGKSVKTWQQWTKYWADKKLAVKKKAALREAAVASGSDPDMVVELTEVEQHILALGARGRLAAALPGYDNSCSEIDVSNTTSAETLMIDNKEVVLLVSSGSLAEKASPSPQSPAACPSPSPPEESYWRRRTSKPAAAGPPPFRYTGTRLRRLGRSQPPPTEPTQRRSHLASLTEKFLRIEQQRLQLEQRNTSILETMAGVASQLMERDFERERVFAQALQTVGDGLRLLADALTKDEPLNQM